MTVLVMIQDVGPFDSTHISVSVDICAADGTFSPGPTVFQIDPLATDYNAALKAEIVSRWNAGSYPGAPIADSDIRLGGIFQT